MAIRRILFPTDYSEVSNSAWHVAYALARVHEATLVVIHVHQWAESENADHTPSPPPPEELARLRSSVPDDLDIPCEFHLLHYRPPGEAGVVVDYARQSNADLIVVGTHARSGITHWLMGSVAESILRQAECQVIAVKPASEE